MLSSLLLLPLLGVIISNLPVGSLRKNGLWVALLLAALQIGLVVFGAKPLFGDTDVMGKFLSLGFASDNLTMVMLLSIGIVAMAALLVGMQTVKGENQRSNFVSLVLVAMVGMNGTVMLTDLFSLYVFLEVTGVASFILIAGRRTLASLEGAFTYLVLSAVATILMLTSLSLLMIVAGSTSFDAVRAAVNLGSPMVIASVGLFVCGLLIKGGVVPFHTWLPGAYSSAPAGVSVLLAGIITKVSGIYTLVRLVTPSFGQGPVFGGSPSIGAILMMAGAISIVVGALAAMGQTDFKKMLAYSSISQVGYIVLGVGCGTPLAIAGAIFHLFNHSIFKSLLFVNAAAVEEQLGTTDMNKMGGLGSRMPATNATSLVAFLSTAGVPPLSGFWSKLAIVLALWQSGLHVYAFVAILASVLTLAYLLMMQRKVFFGILPDSLASVKEAGSGIVVPAVALALVIVGVGIFFPLMFNSFLMPISSFLK
jgi:proton-translocating NADH-quinone oxidoreductase chain N